MTPMFLPRNWDRLDLGFRDQIPAGLILEYRDEPNRNASNRCRQRAAGIGEEVDVAGKVVRIAISPRMLSSSTLSLPL